MNKDSFYSPPYKDKDNILVYHRKYSSLSELVAKSLEPSEHLRDDQRESRNNNIDEWSGGSFNDVVELATCGWPEGLKQIRILCKQHRHIFDKLFPKKDYSKGLKHVVSGQFIDMGLAVQGVPESMVEFSPDEDSKVEEGNQLQRIVFSSKISCFIAKESLYLYGAVLYTLIEAMELHGFRTEIIFRSSGIPCSKLNLDTSKVFVEDVKIKSFEDTLDVDKLAFCCAHSGMLRRLHFGAEETESSEIIKLFGFCPIGGYSRPCDYEGDIVDPKTDIFIPLLRDNLGFEAVLNIYMEIVKKHFNSTL